ncbi:ribosome maturation factor RimP [Fodinisporobacter ferrooxydans]|uniref:Ribosome maturation factor RimP n=1 Tax=Fodinisporobacter ferrooxydans TaxID=2901836 RepID=A0ABY4CFX5_9BACL|nr:ribosome maturation factor RimP [Alicyclobacillaceae bacterium MYW30-H2]
MAKRKVTEVVEELVQPIIDEFSLELVEIEYKKEGTHWFLRVFIDRPDGNVDIEDCGRVSERLSEKLDEVDPIPNSYFLEVSSPGAERPLKKLKDFERAIEKHAWITTYEPINGMKSFDGTIAEVMDGTVAIHTGKDTVAIPFDKIASARLVVDF